MSNKNLIYKRRSVDATHGFDFEYWTTIKAYLNCTRLHTQVSEKSGVKSFSVANNMDDIGVFDDVVTRVEYFDEGRIKTKLILVQCKHIDDPEKNSANRFSKTLNDKNFLQKLFDTFIKMHYILHTELNQSVNQTKIIKLDFAQQAKEIETETKLNEFFNCNFTDCEFVFYANIKLNHIDDLGLFEFAVQNTGYDITKQLFGTDSDRWLCLKHKDAKSLKCHSVNDHLKAEFCKQFRVLLIQNYNIDANKMLSSLPVHIFEALRKEVEYHYNSSKTCKALSEESKITEKIEAYCNITSKSGEILRQYKKDSITFSVENIQSLGEIVNSQSDAVVEIQIQTKFKELEKRRIVQYFNSLGNKCVFLFIENDEDKENWRLARDAHTYNNCQHVNICSNVSILPLENSSDRNEVIINITDGTDGNCFPDFERFSPETKEKILSTKIRFQGKIVNIRDAKLNCLEEKDIIAILENNKEFKLCEPLEGLDFYVPRNLKIKSLKTEILKRISISSRGNCKFLLVSGENKIIPGTEGTYAWFIDLKKAREFMNNIPKNNIDSIHICDFNSENLELIYSRGNGSNLIEYKTIDEVDFQRRLAFLKISILSDVAGMGKTTTLKNLALKYKDDHPSHWVYFVQLNLHLDKLKKFKVSENSSFFIEFIAMEILTISGTERENFINACKNTGNVALFFDAFDEISPDAEQNLLLLLQTLECTEIKRIFVSSRPNYVRSIEQYFQIYCTTFVPFDFEHRKRFLFELWNKKLKMEKLFDITEEQILNAIDCFLDGTIEDKQLLEELLSIPLLIKMIGDLRYDYFKSILKFRKSTATFKNELYNLYDDFIDYQIVRFQTEKLGNWKNTKDSYIKATLADYRKDAEKFSINALYPEYIISDSGDFKTVILKLSEQLGLLTSINPPVFLHRTFGEFFAANYLVDQIFIEKNKQYSIIFYESILLEPKYDVLRKFLNATFHYHNLDFSRYQNDISHLKRDSSGNTALHVAASEGNDKIFILLLQNDQFNINVTNAENESPLLLACKYNKTELANYILEQPGIDVHLCDEENGDSSLYYAAGNGNCEIINRLLLFDSTLLNKQNFDGNTALNIAFIYNKIDAAKKLLTFTDIMVNLENCIRQTAMHHASITGNVDCIILLLQRDPTLLNKQDTKGNTALHLACVYEKTEAVKHLLTNKDCLVYLEDDHQQTALHRATENENIDIMTLLLQHDRTLLNKHDYKGDTPLLLAIACYNINAVKHLLTYTDCLIYFENYHKQTALHRASKIGNVDTLKLLLKSHPTLINQQDVFGNTALYYAIQFYCIESVKYLLSIPDCVVSLKNRFNRNILHAAAKNKWILVDTEILEIIKSIVKLDSTMLNQQDNKGFTPMHVAIKYRNYSKIEFILSISDLVWNIQDNHGNTYLHAMAMTKIFDYKDNRHILNLLQRYPQLIDMKNKNGDTALHIAAKYRNKIFIENLLSESDCKVIVQDKNGDTPLHIYIASLRNGVDDDSGDDDSDDDSYYSESDDENMEQNNGISKEHDERLLIIRVLVNRCPSILNMQNKKGQTPLHNAVLVDDQCVKQLLDFGARNDITDANVDTPLDLAFNLLESDAKQKIILHLQTTMDVQSDV